MTFACRGFSPRAMIIARSRFRQAGIISCFMAYPAPNSMLAIFGGTDFSLANSRIIEPYFSMAKAPYGFTVDEAKWRTEYAT